MWATFLTKKLGIMHQKIMAILVSLKSNSMKRDFHDVISCQTEQKHKGFVHYNFKGIDI